MIIYHSDIRGFRDDIFAGSLAEELDRKVRESYRQSSPGEINAWRNSLQYMYMVLGDRDIPDDAGVAIEYMIPSTSKRIDFIVSGYDEHDRGSVVIIELKQWSDASIVEGTRDLVETRLGRGLRIVPHPSYQAWSYAKLLEDFNESVQDHSITLKPCAYLHNYLIQKENDPLMHIQYAGLLEEAPFFDQRGAAKLAAFVKKYVRKGDRKKVLYDIENGRIRPSKSLQDRLASMLEGNREFVMIDDQKVVYERVLSMTEKTRVDGKKRVMIVEGGPGTGKSVVAVNLLCEVIRRGMVVHYITKNAAPRNVYKTKLKGSFSISSIDNLFRSSGGYFDGAKNKVLTDLLDLAVVDEAHRLNEKSGLFGNRGENQIKEIIESSKCAVFFVDDDQIISLQDIGTKEELLRQARLAGAIIYEDRLVSQFRCNGSEGYIAWLDDVLQIRETANPIFDVDYDFGVVETPQELLRWVSEKNQNNKARVLAGYCWEWPVKSRNNPQHHDIVLEEYGFGMSWNLNQGIWAIDPDSVNAAGCIHTSQGLEFEYVGVIIGPDMFYSGGTVQTNYEKRAGTDKSLRGIKKMSRDNPVRAQALADRIIRNTYRTLLSRGMKGCRVFCTDLKLAVYFKRRIAEYEEVVYPSPDLDYGVRIADDER